MKTYTLTPTRWLPDHTIKTCAESEAELWSIYEKDQDWPAHLNGLWMADFHQRTDAESYVAYLRNREQVRELLAAIPAKGDV